MEGVDFLDSTGLGVLVGGLKRVRAHEGTLRLVCTQERILKIFRITGLTKVFPIHCIGRRGTGRQRLSRPNPCALPPIRLPNPARALMPKVELHIGALPVHVRTARLVAASLGRRIGLDAAAIDEVKLAVGEACSRAVIVHNATGAKEPIIVQFRDDDDVLEVAVLDCGPGGERLPRRASPADSYLDRTTTASGFSPMARPRSSTPGLGLAMIAGLVDDVTVEDRSEPGGTVVTMRWTVTAS